MLLIAFFLLALAAFALAPLAARGGARAAYAMWGFVGLLSIFAVVLAVDLAINPHLYGQLMRLGGG